MVESREIYIVPNFISEGYFCQQVLPRELRLTGPTTERSGRVIHYCDPVGIHPNMTRLLMQRADEVAPGVPRDQTSLIIVGHGTNLNENSTKAIQDQVKLIREGGYGFAEVLDTYMEEAPFVADWQKLTTTPNVIVVPFFIADGLHSFQDIPVLLGIESEVGAAASECEIFRQNPISMHGRSLYYSSAIGTEAHMADVILDQVEDFDRKHRPASPPHSSAEPAGESISESLTRWLGEGRKTIGQISIETLPGGSFQLRHVADRDLEVSALQRKTAPLDAREIARPDAAGKFRPLKSAPTLSRGWLLELQDVEELRAALDVFYPAALGMFQHLEKGTLSPVSLREMLGRQTGMYRFARTIQDYAALEMIASNCDTATKCMRRILWDLAPDQPLTGDAAAKAKAGPHEAGSIPLLCVEACCHVLSESRRIAKAAHEAAGQ
jgi:sirohydrochlorin cobaltochelatase